MFTVTACSRISYTFIILASSLTLGTASNTAFAGFEWVPSSKATTQTPSSAPAPSVSPETHAASQDQTASVPSAPMANKQPVHIKRQAIQPSEEPMLEHQSYSSQPVQLAPIPTTTLNEGQNTVPEKAPAHSSNAPHIIMQDDAPKKAIEHMVRMSPKIKNHKSEHAMPSYEPVMTPYLSETDAPMNQQAQPAPALRASAPKAPTIPKQNAVGFAKDIPLVMALRQIVPAQYAFSFSDGINPGVLVSWNGGKPWDVVLNDILIPLNYDLLIQDNIVIIRSKDREEAAALQSITPAAGEISNLENSQIKQASQNRNVEYVPAQ